MRHRLFLLVCVIAVGATVAAVVGAASAATGNAGGRVPVHRHLPTIAGKAAAGALLKASPGRWSGARTLSYRWERCSAKATRCKLIRKGKHHHPVAAKTYRLAAADVGHRLRVTVRAANQWGATSATSRATATVTRAGAGGPSGSGSGSGSGNGSGTGSGTGSGGGGGTSPGGGAPSHFSTVPSSGTGSAPAGIPRSDATCAAWVRPAPENRPQNTTANHTVPSNPSAINWGTDLNGWPKFVADRNLVTGNYTGTTDEILQWVACKWGIDEDIVRADAVIESYWVQSTLGDDCRSTGEGSYGLLQVKNKDCSGAWVHGGYPYTQNDSALDVDYWGARLRACYDGAFYANGSSWLYNGQTMAQIIAAHGQDYALWGCIGSWFSGNWYDSGAQGYISKVQSDYQSKPWLKPGF